MTEKLTYQHQLRVEFPDTDMAGMVHFSNILRYMEQAEYALLRSLGLSVVLSDERGKLGFPRLSVKCDYLLTAQFEEILNVALSVQANDGKQIHYEFQISRGEEIIARGEFMVACCRFPIEGRPYAIPIPDIVLEKIPLTS